MKFLVDECLMQEVAERLTAAGHDAVHARDLSLLGATDVVRSRVVVIVRLFSPSASCA